MKRRSMMVGFLSCLLALGMALGGCSSGETAKPKLLSIQVTPASAKIVVGETKQFSAIGFFEYGPTRDISREVIWTSSNELVATIDANGVAKGISEGGTTLITAVAGKIMSDPAALEVVKASERLVSIEIEPSVAQIQLGASRSFKAVGGYLDGSSRDITEMVTWESSNPTLVAISNNPGSKGLAIGLAAGTVEITAQSADIVSDPASATVTQVALISIAISPLDPVLPLGTTQKFRATGTFSDDSTADLTKVVSWMSSNYWVADFSDKPGEEGLCQALAEGTTSVTAIMGSVISSPVSLTVTSATLLEIAIQPSAPSVPVGTTVQFSATGTYSDGQVRDLTDSASWQSSNLAVVGFDGQVKGLARALTPGSAQVWAVQSGIETLQVTMTVTSATLESLEISPVNPILPVGQQLQFTAFGHYSDKSVVDITKTASWNSSDKAVATVSNSDATKGLATGLAAGSTTISATLEGIAGQQTLAVRDIEIVSMVVTPNPATLPVGEHLQYRATATFSDNSQAEVTDVVTWRVGNTQVAEIGNSATDHGLATARSIGSTTVWCVSANLVASSPVQLTVTSASLTSISVSPTAPSVVVGSTVNFTATGRYTDGSQLDITQDAVWVSSNQAAATISNSAGSKGVATALAAGVAQITASKDGITSSAVRLEVVAPTLESIAVTPANASITVGETIQYTAMGHYSDNQDRDITQLAYWNSSNPIVVSISNATSNRGLATGTGQGNAQITAEHLGVLSPAVSIDASSPVNKQPVAQITGDSTAIIGSAASFSGKNSYDPDGTIAKYVFNFGDGTGDIDNGANPDITHSFASANTFTVVLTVTDNLGAIASDSLQISVTPNPNQAPHAVLICPSSGLVGQSLEFDATSSYDNDGTIAKYVFNFGDGSGDVDNGLDPSIFHAFNANGTYTVVLTVVDDAGAQNQASCPVGIGSSTLPDVRIIRPQGTVEVTQGQALNVLVDANGQGGFSITRVEMLADSVKQGEDPTAPYEFSYTVPTTASTGSTITLQAKAYDNNAPAGMGQSQPVFLAVKNYPPVASFTATVSDALQVTVDATSSSDVETPAANLEVRWDWESDGNFDTGWSTAKVLPHNYPADGSYTITMQIRDAVGQTDSAQRTVDLASTLQVAGTVTTTTWYGTIIVTGSVTVPAGEVLTVNANTQILVMFLDQNVDGIGDFGITINGSIVVNGTEASPVLFTVYGSSHKVPGAWQGMVVSGTTASSFNYTTVEYANVGLELRNASTVSNSTFRFNKNKGLYLNNADGAALSNVTAHDNQGEGIVLNLSDNVTMTGINCQANGSTGLRLTSSNSGSLTTCLVSGNGADGIDLIDSTLDISYCNINTNQGYGVLYRGASNGSLKFSQVTYNDDAGIRAESTSSSHPAPAINYNNIYGNSVVGGTATALTDASAVLNLTGYSNSGTYTSSVWNAPNSGILRRVFADFYWNYYATGYLLEPNDTQIASWSSSSGSWYWVNTRNLNGVKVRLYNSYTSSSSASNRMTVTQVEYDTHNNAGLELSVAVNSGTVNARYNYFGAFPNVLDHVAYNYPASLDLQGFVGVAFDETWSTGPYKAGNLSTESWSGTIYITGDTNVPAAATLTIQPGTLVQFVPTDQDFDGKGDYGIYVSGRLTADGNASQRITFTALGSTPATASFDRVQVGGAGTSSISYADFRYGHVGLQLGDGSRVSYSAFENNNTNGLYLTAAHGCALDHLTIQNSVGVGLYANNADNTTLSYITVKNNGGIGAVMTGSTGVTVSYLTAEMNGAEGMKLDSSGSGTISDSTFKDNAGDGLLLINTSSGIDHCAFLYNGGVGVRYRGSSSGTLAYSNLKYNDLPGVLLYSTGTGANPAPNISTCNIYGNSVDHSVQAFIADPSAVLNLTGYTNSGTYNSSIWNIPGTGLITRANVDFYWNYYATGYLLQPNDTQISSWASSYTGALWVDTLNLAGLKVRLYNSYTSSSSASNRMRVSSVEYLLDVPMASIELTAAVFSGQAKANANYWGQSENIFQRISTSRSDAVDYTGWLLSEVSPCGPR